MPRKGSKSVKFKEHIILFILLSFCFGILLSGCSDDSSVSVPISQKAVALKNKVKKTVSDSLKAKQTGPEKRKRTMKAQPVKPVKLNAQEKSKLKEVIYKSKITALRDPFVPFIKFTERSAKQKVKKPLLPLQRYALSQLVLIAIIDAGKKGKWAMVQDASGKGYMVREGMPIGSEGGIVKEILPDQIVVERTKVDLLGKKKVILTGLKLHPEKKGE